MTTVSTGTCTSCRLPIEAGTEYLVCSTCGKQYHVACWQAAGQCATLGCNGMPIAEQAPRASAAPPPSVYAAPSPVEAPPPVYAPPPSGYLPPTPNIRANPAYSTPASAAPAEISFNYALSAGWESFREYMGLTIGAALLLFILALPSLIPVIGMFYPILVFEPIKGGFCRFLLKGATRQQPDISDLFSGFAEWGNWIGLWGMRLVIAIVAAAPILLGLLIIIATVGLASLHTATTSHDAGQLFSALGAAGIGIMVIAVLCSIGLSIYAASRWLFAGYAIVEGYGVMDAFRRSDELTEGRRPQLIGIGILFSLLEMVGIVCLILPGLFFMGIMAFALPALYVELSARE